MISYISHVMTLANSIIGVSVLAMPFCFKQCGIILSIVVLTLCSLLSRIACHFLIKSAVMSRRRNYEFLAFHAFGPMGKILVELLIIGFLIGTCIAFFVVVGDLGPQIIGKLLNKNSEDIKISFLLTTASLIVLPLGLLKNIESLASICTVAIGFYICLVLKVFTESMGHIITGDWYEHVNYWRPSGILQCLPIFSMALFCQTQLFEIYESIPNVSLEKMNVVVKGAINICTLVYICVGFFGYVAFCTQPFSGNILMNFEPSIASDVIKIGFVLSVIASFPLVIFPCRASLNSLLFRRVYIHEAVTNYIPEIRFRCLTFTIITVSLITGLLMPNIEFVLGVVGSTIGVLICLIFPAAFFIAISTKNTNERLIAQTILFIGMWIMMLGTYANIYSVEESSMKKIAIFTEQSVIQMNNIQLESNIESREIIPNVLQHEIQDKDQLAPLPQANLDKILNPNNFIDNDKADVQVKLMGQVINNMNLTLDPLENKKTMDNGQIFHDNSQIQIANFAKSETKIEEEIKAIDENEQKIMQQANENLINSDAIKKEESEIAAAADHSADAEAIERLKERERFKDILEQNKIEQMELIKQTNAILHNLEEKKKESEMKKKLLNDLESNKFNDNIAQSNMKAVEMQLINNKDKQLPILPLNNQLINNERNENPAEFGKIKEELIEKENLNKDLILVQANYNQELNNLSLQSRGPILNALISNPIQQANSNILLINEDINKKKNQNDSNNIQYAIPIALKLINQTKDNIDQVIQPVDNVNKLPVLHRDILEDRTREKRNAHDYIPEINNIKNINITNNNKGSNDCEKNDSRVIVDNKSIDYKNILNIQSTTELIIKTNVYLSDEKFVYNIDKLNSNSLINNNDEYQIVKKRDLKSLKFHRKSQI